MEKVLTMAPETIARLLGTVGSPLIVISELIKNAVDACADKIDIDYNTDLRSITVTDDGHGFSLKEIEQLSAPGLSAKKKDGNVLNRKGSFYTGNKGLGLLSVFSLCDSFTITTKSDNGNEYIIKSSKGKGNYSYELQKTPTIEKGTQIILNNISEEIMTLLISESEIKKLRHISTFLYKHDIIRLPKITLSINDGEPSSLLFKAELKDMLYDVTFSYNSVSKKMFFKCLAEGTNINSKKIEISSFGTDAVEAILEQHYNIIETIKTRTNDDVQYHGLENSDGVPSFEGRLLIYEKRTAGELKDYGAGVNIYVNSFALYNYLSEDLDWLGLADFSQRKKATRLKPHNVFGFVNIPEFNELNEKLKISNERADFIKDAIFTKFMYLIKGVVLFMILNIDVAEKNPRYKGDINGDDISGDNQSQRNKDEKEDAPPKETTADESDDTDKSDDADESDETDGNFLKQSEETARNYEPEKDFKPQSTKTLRLYFTDSEGQSISTLKNKSDISNKIYQIVCELSKLDVKAFPYSTVALYRSLIDASTFYACQNSIAEYKDNQMLTSITNVLNAWRNNNHNKEFCKSIDLWRDLVNKRLLLDKLNLYIHYNEPVDTDFVISTWKSMKGYVYNCILTGNGETNK